MRLSELAATFNILKKKLPNYEDRPQQMEMAEEVFACLKDNKNLLIEAGTGVGKSFAYLIPAILSGEKTVVSTASIALQDQLVNKDLVFLQKSRLFGTQKFSFAILKGKNNYLCLKREREFVELGESYKRFSEWVSRTKTGDKDELTFIPDFWSRVCGDSDDCNANQCPFYSKCFYYVHFRSLYKKDIIVVNHHLLIYDLLSDFSLLPSHKQLIIDEAHQLEDVISHVFGGVLNHSRVVWLLYRLRGLKIAVDHLFEPVDSFFKRRDAALQTIHPIPDEIIEGLKNLKGMLTLDKIVRRLDTYSVPVSEDEVKDRITTTINYVNSLVSVINDFIDRADSEKVYYMTANRKSLELKSSLVESQKPFNDLISAYNSVIMTSATLTAGGDFGFINNRLGITNPQSSIVNQKLSFKEMVIGSPFDYQRQSLLYIDKELPSPVKENNEVFQQKGLKTVEGLVNASNGRALVLFTSYKHLNFVAEHISIDYPYKCQGDMPPARLIEWFKKTHHSVLLATTTFWQGIDIKGEDLSLVIIVKMPFGSPGDPVYDERCRRLGERWFADLALPSAILLLRQGFGRLIRGVDEYGVVAILDTRLVTSSYGGTIIASLPEMNVVHNIEDVKSFFDSLPEPVSSKEVQTLRQAIIRTGNDGNSKGFSHVVALGNSNDLTVIPELISFTGSKNGNERRLAASALGKFARFRPEIYEAVEALEMLLGDEKPQVRHYALKAVGRIGRLNQKKLKSVIDNPLEKGYNVSLARRLIRKTEKGV